MLRKTAFVVIVLAYSLSSSSLASAELEGCNTSFTDDQVATLIAKNYVGAGQSSLVPTITLQPSPNGFTFRVVCSSLSGKRNQYRFVSIVAYYTTSDGAVSPPGVPIYGQFEFECVSSAWSATSSLLDNPSKDRTTLSAGSPAITANITTNCAYCLKKSVSSTERVSDDTNHCSACTGCSQPLCYTPDTAIPNSGTIRQTCCNFYLSDGTCTTACPPSYFPDDTRTCIPCFVNCQNGGVPTSDVCGCDCSASVVFGGTNCSVCQCQNGGVCSGSTCSCPPGYTGTRCETPCPTSCQTGYFVNNCNCVLCNLTCQNGGTMRSDACGCDCSASLVYEGTSCTLCKCQNGGICSGSTCQTGYYINNCNCVQCLQSCQNGGVLRNDTCTCDCTPSIVYGGTSCTVCQCQNGGICSGSTCSCPPGYTGTRCETPCPTSCPAGYYINNCNCVQCLQSCQNGGVLRSDTCTCDCTPSIVYGGTSCTVCQCQNGGICSGSTCSCPPGYTGTRSQCLQSCQNGGVLRNDTCTCDCTPSIVYGGTSCTVCQCQNGGVCSGSTCSCPPGYTGTRCETPCPTSCPAGYYINNCNCVQCLQSCQNGGVLRNDTCTCDCTPSIVYGGTSCTVCQCQNGGICSGSTCSCPPGYTGTRCETPCPTSCPAGYYINNCNCVQCRQSCQNGGVLRSDTCTCDCTPSIVYGGTSCTVCQCQNGGICSGSTCSCPPGYTGTRCETPCPTSCPAGYYINNCNCEIMNEVDDTVVADPLISVRLALPSELSTASLCYEFHGLADKYFNLLSNNCTSINAHYAAAPAHPTVNIVDEIAIRTADLADHCVDISVNLGCAVSVNGVRAEPNQVYSMSGVKVTQYGGAEVQVSVPGCRGGQSLGVQVYCQSGTLFDVQDGGRFTTRTMKVVVRHSLSVAGGGGSHGLLGQFWNIHANMQNYAGAYDGPSSYDYYVLSLDFGNGKRQRAFVAALYPFTWERKRDPCLYAGNSNGGSIVEVNTPNDSVIEGQLEDYIVSTKFSTQWKYSVFAGSCRKA
eukprot:Em0005g1435a